MSYRYFQKKGPEKVRKFHRPKPRKGTKPLVGWRSWGIAWPDVRLYSRSAEVVWDSPTHTTKKMSNGKLTRVSSWNPIRTRGALKVAEDPYHDFGVYSYKTVDMLHNLHRIEYGQVVGLIESSGHIVEHEYGYRAQICVIKRLWYVVKPPHMELHITYEDHRLAADKLEECYQCPVQVIQLQSFLNQHLQPQ